MKKKLLNGMQKLMAGVLLDMMASVMSDSSKAFVLGTIGLFACCWGLLDLISCDAKYRKAFSVFAARIGIIVLLIIIGLLDKEGSFSSISQAVTYLGDVIMVAAHYFVIRATKDLDILASDSKTQKRAQYLPYIYAAGVVLPDISSVLAAGMDPNAVVAVLLLISVVLALAGRILYVLFLVNCRRVIFNTEEVPEIE